MSLVIWKFHIELTDVQKIKMPYGADILTVQMQNGVPVLWAICNPDAPMHERTIQVIGTGNRADHALNYIGTVQTHGGSFVWHVFSDFSAQRKLPDQPQ